jgi:hypothetical protein
MYAVVTVFRMDDERFAEQEGGLHEFIIPSVKQNPGFRAGYWTRDRAAGRSHNLLLFDTEEHARHAARSVEKNAEGQRATGIHLEALAVTEVVGEAHE